jgi:hypothetical protein
MSNPTRLKGLPKLYEANVKEPQSEVNGGLLRRPVQKPDLRGAPQKTQCQANPSVGFSAEAPC